MKKLLLCITFFYSSLNFAQSLTVLDVVVDSENHTILETAVIEAGLAETLSSNGPFTVFAPTDDAFNLLPDGAVESLLADTTGTLAALLTSHVSGGSTFSTSLFDGMIINTVAGTELTVSIDSNGVYIENALVTVADLTADNGVVHVINAVLVPEPEVVSNTVVDVIVGSPDHILLASAVVAAELAETLSGDGPFTVFAPTDDAFGLLPEGLITELLADPTGELATILTHHVYAGNALSTDLFNDMMVPTLAGTELTVSIMGDMVQIDNATVTVADIVTDNGVVHVIDAVLVPTEETLTVVDVVVDSENHTILETAVVAAGLAETLSGEGPFTVFAPTDDAFGLLPEGSITELLADPTGELATILTHHVYAGNALSTDLSNGMTVPTLAGTELTVSIMGNMVQIDDANVTVANIVTDNGVVHVIDAVLVPSNLNIKESITLPSQDNYLYSLDIMGKKLSGVTPNQIVFDVYSSGKVIKRYTTIY